MIKLNLTERQCVSFSVGQTVVYPHHGAAVVQEIKTRIIRDTERIYLKLNVAQNDLVIEVPADNVELVGVRDVIDSAGLEAVYNVLTKSLTEEPVNWSRRFKLNAEKIASGDILKIAEVVRDLWRRGVDKGLSTGEKRMYAKAHDILVSELSLALGVGDEEVKERIESVLKEESESF